MKIRKRKVVGFTGTRKGMTRRQRREFTQRLKACEATHFRHGGCVGADIDAHQIAKRLGLYIIVHPSDVPGWLGDFRGADVIKMAKPPLIRNHDIVDRCTLMFAAPDTLQEKRRSGTWATIRYARSRGRKLVILEP